MFYFQFQEQFTNFSLQTLFDDVYVGGANSFLLNLTVPEGQVDAYVITVSKQIMLIKIVLFSRISITSLVKLDCIIQISIYIIIYLLRRWGSLFLLVIYMLLLYKHQRITNYVFIK